MDKEKTQARIYVPGVFVDKAYESVKCLEGIIELRDGFALPVILKGSGLEMVKVWRVDVKNPSTPPKFYASRKGFIGANIEELVQPGITTSSYLQSRVSLDKLKFFREIGDVSIYDGEFPVLEGYNRRADGTIILTGFNNSEIIGGLFKDSPFEILTMREMLDYSSNSRRKLTTKTI